MKESELQRVSREMDEKEAKEKFDKLEKDKFDKLEKERMLVIINKYLDGLDKQLTEKKSWKFWTFPDRSGFKKYKSISLKDMQKIVSKDVEYYKDRNVALINMRCSHNEPKDSIHAKSGVLLSVTTSKQFSSFFYKLV